MQLCKEMSRGSCDGKGGRWSLGEEALCVTRKRQAQDDSEKAAVKWLHQEKYLKSIPFYFHCPQLNPGLHRLSPSNPPQQLAGWLPATRLFLTYQLDCGTTLPWLPSAVAVTGQLWALAQETDCYAVLLTSPTAELPIHPSSLNFPVTPAFQLLEHPSSHPSLGISLAMALASPSRH